MVIGGRALVYEPVRVRKEWADVIAFNRWSYLGSALAISLTAGSLPAGAAEAAPVFLESSTLYSAAADDRTAAQEVQAVSDFWREGPGSGFRRGTRQFGFAVGGGPGLRTLGSRQHHDLVLGSLHYGRTLGRNWAWQAELFGGAQVRPEDELLVGGTYLIRYHFPTHSRWLPFANLGAGLTYTSIREPDLSTGFEFNLVGGIGTHYFYARDTAVTLEARWLHLSNGGLDSPNRGTNTVMLFGGLSWFY